MDSYDRYIEMLIAAGTLEDHDIIEENVGHAYHNRRIGGYHEPQVTARMELTVRLRFTTESAAASFASFAVAPLTDLHPPEGPLDAWMGKVFRVGKEVSVMCSSKNGMIEMLHTGVNVLR